MTTYHLEILKIAMIQPPGKLLGKLTKAIKPPGIAPMPKTVKGGTMPGFKTPAPAAIGMPKLPKMPKSVKTLRKNPAQLSMKTQSVSAGSKLPTIGG